MDKNQVTMIAVGAGIVGLLVNMSVSSLGDGGKGNKNSMHDDKSGMMDTGDNNYESQHGGTEMGNKMTGMNMGGKMIESEREYITEMIPHHAEAIASSKKVLARGGTTPEIKALAQNIITSQEAEVASMKTMFKDWYSADYKPEGDYTPMMRDVSDLAGAELDKAFLTDMIMHHQMAISMSEGVTAYLVHDELKTLSTNIKTNQAAELETMKTMLKTLQ